jgi:hypothetical protein
MNHSQGANGCGGRCILELIRARAYQLYHARGCKPCNELEDWLRAELEVKQQLGFEPVCEREDVETR